jgi:hypothetical protein
MKRNYTSFSSSYNDQNKNDNENVNKDANEDKEEIKNKSKGNNENKNNKINKNSQNNAEIIENSFNINITESPYWPERAFHIHTQHPLELTDVLQGHDIPQSGMHGPQCGIFSSSKRRKYQKESRESAEYGENGENENWDRNYNENRGKSSARYGVGKNSADSNNNNNDDDNIYWEEGGGQGKGEGEGEGEIILSDYEFTRIINEKKTMKLHLKTAREILENKISYCERWDDMVVDVSSMFEWAVANRLNKIEWLLLGNYKWGDELETRMKR